MLELFGLFLLYWAGFFIGQYDYEADLIRQCQIEHNVHECEIKALPKPNQSKVPLSGSNDERTK